MSNFNTTAASYSDMHNVLELANLGGKQHPTDIIIPLFPSNFTTDFPLSSTEKIIMCIDWEG